MSRLMKVLTLLYRITSASIVTCLGLRGQTNDQINTKVILCYQLTEELCYGYMLHAPCFPATLIIFSS